MPEEKVCFTVSKLSKFGELLKKIGTVPDEEIVKELRELKEEMKVPIEVELTEGTVEE